ncbi:MAG: SPOR domain-containing protein [Desulfovibrionaceae bacterium]
MAQASSPSGGNPRKGDPVGKRSYTLRLTASSIMTAVIVLVIGIGWSFVLGVMVGRGYNPEKKIPQLASFLPKEDDTTQAPTSRVGENQPADKVMKAEDLSYAASLKGKPGQGKLAPPPPKPGTEPKPKNMQNATAPVAAVFDPATGAAQGNVTQAPTDKTAKAQSPDKAKSPAVNQNIYDFTFQVATFKDTGSVDNLRARLEGEGLRTRMEKTKGKTPLYKVMVVFRGNADAAQSIKQRLTDMGLGQPIQRGKSPVGGSPKKS